MVVTNKYRFEGPDGMENMQVVLKIFRYGFKTIGNIEVDSVLDHSSGTDGVTGAGVIEYRLADGSSVEIRPSGTEPKMKAYISFTTGEKEQAEAIEKRIVAEIERKIKG